MNVHKTFRRHPGRLLEVLSLFNLPPVSRGTFTRDSKRVHLYLQKIKFCCDGCVRGLFLIMFLIKYKLINFD